MQAQQDNFCGTTKVDDASRLAYLAHKYDITHRNDITYVPLSIHILGNDDGFGYYPTNAIYESLCRLNKDFDGSGLQFFVKGGFKYVDETKWYDHEKFSAGNQMMNALSINKTVNCFIVDNPAGNCGYYSYNGDAVALKKSCLGPVNHTWAHELGHFFSLPHTFYGWEGIDYDENADTPVNIDGDPVELLDGSNCEIATDGFCDTPADYLSYRWSCNSDDESLQEQKDPTGASFRSDGTLFMSYSNDNCASRFSQEQMEAMIYNLNNNRPGLISNENPKEDLDPINTVLTYPIDGEFVSNVVTFEWEEIGDAEQYMLEVSKFENFGLVSVREYVIGTSFSCFTLKENKDYFWRLSPYNNYSFCTTPTDTQSFSTGNLSVVGDESEVVLEWAIAPNPSSENQSIHLFLSESMSEAVFVEIFTISGKQIYTEIIETTEAKSMYQLDRFNPTSGVYFIKLFNQNTTSTKKMIIQ